MAEDKSRSPGNGSTDPDISDIIRVLRAAAGIGDNEQATDRQARQLSREMPDKPSAEHDTGLPKDRVEFSPEAMKKLSERSAAKAVGNARNGQSAADPGKALNALKFFREMSGAADAEMPDKPGVEASRNNAVQLPGKLPEKPSAKTSAKAAAKAENSPQNTDSDEAKSALDFFRKMSGVTGAQMPQTPDKSEVEASQNNAVKPPDKPSGKTSAKAAAKAENSPPNTDSDEAKSALDFFRKMSGVTGAQVPQAPDKPEVEAFQNSTGKSPEKPSGKTSAKAAAKAENSPPDSDEAENALKFFREMSGITGSEPTEQMPDKSDDSDDEASAGAVRDEQLNDGQIQTENEQSQKDEPEEAAKPRPYKPFDITDIPRTELHAAPPVDEPEEDSTEKCSLAVCGADCNDCPFGEENDCPGCGGLWEDCDIVRCAAVKGYEHCGLCDKFPCDLLREASFDPDSGDNGERLLRLKSLGEAADSRKKPRLIMAGGCGGIALGTAIGGFSGALLPWIFAMTVVGAGVGLMAAVSVKNKGSGDRGKKQT